MTVYSLFDSVSIIRPERSSPRSGRIDLEGLKSSRSHTAIVTSPDSLIVDAQEMNNSGKRRSIQYTPPNKKGGHNILNGIFIRVPLCLPHHGSFNYPFLNLVISLQIPFLFHYTYKTHVRFYA